MTGLSFAEHLRVSAALQDPVHLVMRRNQVHELVAALEYKKRVERELTRLRLARVRLESAERSAEARTLRLFQAMVCTGIFFELVRWWLS